MLGQRPQVLRCLPERQLLVRNCRAHSATLPATLPFLLNAATTGRLHPKGAPSLAINFFGASLILLSLMRTFNLAAAIVEAAWAFIALVGLVRLALARLRAGPRG